MKTKQIFSSAACIALSIFAVGCSSDETTTTSGNSKQTSSSEFTTFVGTMNNSPVTRVQINNLYDTPVNTINGLDVTRASMERTSDTGAGTFSWESGDYVYVSDDTNNWLKSTNTVATKGTSFKFEVDGTFSGKEYTVLYKGDDTNANNNVTIKQDQTQSAFNNTEHFKNSGDCGVATAKEETKGYYSFNLEHKASYLCFLPYSTDDEILNNYNKIKKVSVEASKVLAGTYTLTADKGLSLQVPTNPADTFKLIKVTLNAGTSAGFDISDCKTADINKSLYMVVAPGTGHFRVDVTVSNGTKDSLISKTYSTVTLKPNTVNNIPLDLSFKTSTTTLFNYVGEQYQVWDQAKTADCPNVNEMAWYMLKGDVMYDDNTLWVGNDGKTHVGGIWLKRRDVILQENSGTTAEAMKLKASNGKDYRQDMQNNNTAGGISKVIPLNKPTADKIKNYFFMPALGAISNGNLYHHPGEFGFYYGCDNYPSVQYSVPLFCFWSNYIKGHVLKLAYEVPTHQCIINKNFFK